VEPGPLQELPLREDSDLRTRHQTYSPEAMKHVKEVYPWVDDEYDKVPVEEVILADKDISGTTMRLPMIYGPGDPLHRFHWLLKRMDDHRPFIIFPEDLAAWRGVRGYVENVGAAIAMAVSSDKAAGRSYNVCETECPNELEQAKRLAAKVGWKGKFIVLPAEKTPQHLRFPGNLAQHLVGSSEKIRQELGYREPVNLDDAIVRTVEWERVNQPVQGPMFGAFNYDAEDQAMAVLNSRRAN
jgi:nucleoside-diphosphate-sugar epimerase